MTEGSGGALAPEWRRWVVENLLRGADEAELVSVLEGAGVDAALARASVRAELEDPCFEGTRKALALNRKLEGLLDLYGDLYRQADGHEHVERRESLSAEEFFDRYYFQNRPVVVRGAVMSEDPGLRPPVEYVTGSPVLSVEAEGLQSEERPARENLLLWQVHGRRRLQLIPAFELRRMTGTPEEKAAATRLEVEVGPGDLVLVPVGWWWSCQVLEASTSRVFSTFAASAPNATWAQAPAPPEPTPPPWRKRG